MVADLRIYVRQTVPVHDVAPAVFFLGCLLHMHLVDGLCDPLTLSLQPDKHFRLADSSTCREPFQCTQPCLQALTVHFAHVGLTLDQCLLHPVALQCQLGFCR